MKQADGGFLTANIAGTWWRRRTRPKWPMHCTGAHLMAMPKFKVVRRHNLATCLEGGVQTIRSTILKICTELLFTLFYTQTLSQEPLQENCSLTWCSSSPLLMRILLLLQREPSFATLLTWLCCNKQRGAWINKRTYNRPVIWKKNSIN